MDIKDEILLRLQQSIKAKDSYIDYLQRLLKTHHIDFDDINSMSPKQDQAHSSELTRNELYKNASAKNQIDSQYSSYSNNSQIRLSSEDDVYAQGQSTEYGSQILLSNLTNTHNIGEQNKAVNLSTVNVYPSQIDLPSEPNSQQCQHQGNNSDSCNLNVKSESSRLTDSDSEITYQRVYLPRITSDIINRFFSYFHGREYV